jgi:hypothetical protein
MSRAPKTTSKALTTIDGCLCLVAFLVLVLVLALVIAYAPSLTAWAQQDQVHSLANYQIASL